MAVQFMRIESKIWIEVPRHHSTLRLYTTNCLFSSDSSVHPGGHKQSRGPCSENRYSTQLEESVEDNQIYQFWLVRVPKFWCSVQISHLFVTRFLNLKATSRIVEASKPNQRTFSRFPGPPWAARRTQCVLLARSAREPGCLLFWCQRWKAGGSRENGQK